MRHVLTFLLVVSSIGVGWAQSNKNTQVVEDLSPQQLQEFQERCKQVIQEFQEYLPTLADKTRSDFDRQEAFDAIKRLFKEGSTIQVSSKFSKKINNYSIEEYLTILRDTKKYTQIKITFYEAEKVSEFIPDPKGGYRGTATIFQRFEGFGPQGKVIYKDTTRKSVSTQLNQEYDPFYQEKKWKVWLGNVTVEETADVPKNN